MASKVAIDSEAVDEALESLEDAMSAGEMAMQHAEIRPSTTRLAQEAREAYRTLVQAHPDYRLQEDDDAGA